MGGQSAKTWRVELEGEGVESQCRQNLISQNLCSSVPNPSWLNCSSISCERCNICSIICWTMHQCSRCQINKITRGQAKIKMGSTWSGFYRSEPWQCRHFGVYRAEKPLGLCLQSLKICSESGNLVGDVIESPTLAWKRSLEKRGYFDFHHPISNKFSDDLSGEHKR